MRNYLLYIFLLLTFCVNAQQYDSGRLTNYKVPVLREYMIIPNGYGLMDGVYDIKVSQIGFSEEFSLADLQVGDIYFDYTNMYVITLIDNSPSNGFSPLSPLIRINYLPSSFTTVMPPSSQTAFVARPTDRLGLLAIIQSGANYITDEHQIRAINHNFMVIDSLLGDIQANFSLVFDGQTYTNGDTLPATNCVSQTYTSFPLVNKVLITGIDITELLTFDVYLNGFYLKPADYTLTGDTLSITDYTFDSSDFLYVAGCYLSISTNDQKSYLLNEKLFTGNLIGTTTFDYIFNIPESLASKSIKEFQFYTKTGGSSGGLTISVLKNGSPITTLNLNSSEINTNQNVVIPIAENDRFTFAITANTYTVGNYPTDLYVNIVIE